MATARRRPGPPARALTWRPSTPAGGGPRPGRVGADDTVLDDLWAFSLPGRAVAGDRRRGDRPAPRWAAAALHDPVRDRMLLLFGNAAPATDEVWALDLGLRRWSRLGPFATGPVARYDAAVATDGADRVWAYGGFAGPQFRPDTALGDLWELDLAAGAWRPLPGGGTPPPPTTNAALAFHDGFAVPPRGPRRRRGDARILALRPDPPGVAAPPRRGPAGRLDAPRPGPGRRLRRPPAPGRRRRRRGGRAVPGGLPPGPRPPRGPPWLASRTRRRRSRATTPPWPSTPSPGASCSSAAGAGGRGPP